MTCRYVSGEGADTTKGTADAAVPEEQQFRTYGSGVCKRC